MDRSSVLYCRRDDEYYLPYYYTVNNVIVWLSKKTNIRIHIFRFYYLASYR